MEILGRLKDQLGDNVQLANIHDMRDVLTDMCDEHFTQAAVARKLSVSPGYLFDILHGKRGVSENMAKKMGWKAITVYVRESENVE